MARSSSGPPARSQPNDSVAPSPHWLWVLWAGVGCTMLIYRVLLLFQSTFGSLGLPARIARTAELLPVVIYQDVLLLIVLGAGIAVLDRAARARPRISRPIVPIAVVVALGLSFYAALSWGVYDALHCLPSYQLWRRAEGYRGVPAWLEDPVMIGLLAVLILCPALTLVSWWLIRPIAVPGRLRGVRFCPALVILAVLVYGAAAGLTCRWLGLPDPVVENPHWAALVSLTRGIPTLAPVAVAATDPDLDDFRPARDQAAPPAASRVKPSPPENVVVVVLESVAAAYVDGFGAEHRLTPEIRRLAEHGVRYRRISANRPWSSSALAALVCSVYPLLEWQAVETAIPNLAVPGLPEVLRQRGYRTAMFATTDLRFESNAAFALRHGFETLGNDIHEPEAAAPAALGRARTCEDALVDQFLTWVDQGSNRPFGAMLWTSITHSPYRPAGPLVAYDQHNPCRNRYFNAIRQSDQAVGDLARGLARRGLLDRTLLVIVGDHGEAFDEHGWRGHGSCLYEEAVHVPLVICQPGRFARPEVSDVLGQEIDVPPTILDLLHLPAPPLWQGRSLRTAHRPSRIYLFSAWDDLTLGVREGDWKYTFKPGAAGDELYNLAADPSERHNLARDPALRRRVARWRRRLDAWRAYQNNYLLHPRLHAGSVLTRGRVPPNL